MQAFLPPLPLSLFFSFLPQQGFGPTWESASALILGSSSALGLSGTSPLPEAYLILITPLSISTILLK